MNESLVQQLRRMLRESLGEMQEVPAEPARGQKAARGHGEQYETLRSDYSQQDDVIHKYDEDVFDEYDEEDYAGDETSHRHIRSKFDDDQAANGDQSEDILGKSLLAGNEVEETVLERVQQLLYSQDGLATAIVLQEIINRPEHRWQ